MKSSTDPARKWLIAPAALAAALFFAHTQAAPAQSPASMPTSAPTTSPTTLPAADATTPKGALRMLFAATDAGDSAKIKSLIYADSPAQEKMTDVMADMSSSVVNLQKALRDAFGEDQTKALLGDPAAAAAIRDQTLAKLTETITGDTAVIQLQTMGAFEPVTLIRINGLWKIKMGENLKNVDPKALEQQMAVSSIQITVIREVTSDVQAGKFKSVADVKQTLDVRVKQAVMDYVQSSRKSATQPTTEPGMSTTMPSAQP